MFVPFSLPFCACGRDDEDNDRDKIKAKQKLLSTESSSKKQGVITMYSKVAYVVVVLFYPVESARALVIVAHFLLSRRSCLLRVGVILTRNKQD